MSENKEFKTTFTVHDKSAILFFTENCMFNPLGSESKFLTDSRGETSVYHLMRDKIYVKKKAEFEDVEYFNFYLVDHTRGSNSKLVNYYQYRAKFYDDCLIELNLVDFKILQSNPFNPSEGLLSVQQR